MSSIVLLKTNREMQQWRKKNPQKLGFVPTMGALHEGHATLLGRAKESCEKTVLSIFVNPTQFGPTEDLSRYPRTIEQDVKIADREGVSAVFVPTVEEMYPSGFSTMVEESALSLPLCGKFRPGHFKGVTTIVLKLFHAVRPEVAFFGLKDAQQFFVLKKMVSDLSLDVEMVGVPTVREPDGLAMDSRNRYLSLEDRERAPQLYKILQTGREKMSVGESVEQVTFELIQKAQKVGFEVQYIDCVDVKDFKRPVVIEEGHEFLLAAAVFVGKTRLIDNILFKGNA